MNSIYQDKWSRWHHKPCNDGEPSSNNGWIYSAYGVKLGFETDAEKLKECFTLCVTAEKVLIRSPGKIDPPFSRDEILGLFWLGLINTDFLARNKWSFCPYKIPFFNPFGTLMAVMRIGYAMMRVKLSEWGILNCTLGHIHKAHRNSIWKDGGEPHLFRFAFAVPFNDRVHMLKAEGKKVPWLWRMIGKISDIIPSDSASSILLRWGKGQGKLTAGALVHEFGEDHEFTKRFISAA